jgi:hypothetical protein
MSLDLNKLENKLDEALSNETTETLTKFLNDKRMTNNKQQTAVEWLQSIELERDLTLADWKEAKEMEKHQNLIKLPSDEEISEESMDLYGKLSAKITDVLQYKAFKRGAKWMRDKIQGGEQ